MKIQLDRTTWPFTNSFEIDYWWHAFNAIRWRGIPDIAGW